jgi:uncharacterized protein (DUF362 family)
MVMKRRDFIKKSVGVGIASGAAFSILGFDQVFGANIDETGPFDLVAVKGGGPAEMFDKGIASLGGMQQFVKKGHTVTVKPNIGWDAIPEKAANTNPELVGRIVAQCMQAGAKAVYVFDNPVNEWTRCYRNSGIEKAVKDAGGTMVTGKSESHYKDIDIPAGKILKTAKIHELMLDTDLVINVPVLKNHDGTQLTIAMKNLMGVVWDRKYWHANGLDKCIADFATICKPTLNVVDCFRVMKRNGPRGVSVADVVDVGALLISKDIVAVDVAATKMFGMDVEKIKYIRLAHEARVGEMDLEKLKINRIKVA